MSEEDNQKELSKKDYEIEYRFVDHEYKLQFVLSRIAEAEQTHFGEWFSPYSLYRRALGVVRLQWPCVYLSGMY